MLTKILKIDNVGRFRKYRHRGAHEFERLTLVFAENGQGKSTLCDVLRSLGSGDAALIIGRTTLGAAAAPAIELRLDGSTRTFRDGQWSAPFPDIVIFDSAFVHANVYVGDHVSIDQRRGLHSVIVGADGVALAQRVDTLDRLIRDATSEVTRLRPQVQRHVPDGMTLSQFQALPSDPGVDARIVAATAREAAATLAEQITAGNELTRLALPALPADLTALLDTTLESVGADVERQIAEHLTQHMVEADEAWLARGTSLVAGDACPFCGQPVGGNGLIAAYRAKFSEAYAQLLARLDTMSDAIRSLADEAAVLRLERTLSANTAAVSFWGPLVGGALPSVSAGSLKQPLDALAIAAQQRLADKRAALLVALGLGELLTAACQAMAPIEETVATYNAEVGAINARIRAKKQEVAQADVAAIRTELATLRATKVRHAEPAASACTQLGQAESEKARLTAEKEVARRALDAHAATVFGACEQRINTYLEDFGADFRIARVGANYAGGRPQSSYCLVINSCEVPLGDGATGPGVPSFRNTLSAGDKSTLALAFFLSQLAGDVRIRDKIIVMDDPFTSQDRSRRDCTTRHICKLAAQARQILLLSHDPTFLQVVSQRVVGVPVRALQLARLGNDSIITVWDVDQACEDGYFSDHRKLKLYLSGDSSGVDKRDVARSIRPLVEGGLRFRFGDALPAAGTLGEYIALIRSAADDSELGAAKPVLDELEALNDYSTPFQHAETAGTPTGPINDGELRSNVKRALLLVGGF